MHYHEQVKEFIVENFLFGDGNELTDESDFFDEGIVDSTGVLEILCFLEETFEIKIDDEEVTQKNFSTINNVNSYLKRKLSSTNKAS